VRYINQRFITYLATLYSIGLITFITILNQYDIKTQQK